MGSFRDAAGLEYTAAEQQAVDKFTALVSGYLGFTRDVGDRLKDVLDVDTFTGRARHSKGCDREAWRGNAMVLFVFGSVSHSWYRQRGNQ